MIMYKKGNMMKLDNRRGQKTLIMKELNQGKELAHQLRNHLNPIPCSSSSSHQVHPQFLIQKILSSYENAISMLKTSNGVVSRVQPHGKTVNFAMADSPSSCANTSQRSQNSNHHDSRIDGYSNKDSFKKRKTVPAGWSNQVKICSGTGLLESPQEQENKTTNPEEESRQTMLDVGSGKTKDSENKDDMFPWFSFMKSENGNDQFTTTEYFSPTYINPSATPVILDMDNFEGGCNLETYWESDLSEILINNNFPMTDSEFSIGNLDFLS